MSFQRNKSLEDGIAVLNALAASERPVGSRELARLLAMEPTRANRLLKTLHEIGMVEQDANRKYIPGAGIHLLASLSMRSSALLRIALPIMSKYRAPDYLMALGVVWRDKVSYLIHAKPGEPLTQGIAGTGVFPASRSSIGRILTDPASGKPFAEIKNGNTSSVAVPLGSATVSAALAYSGVPHREVSRAVEALKQIAEKINQELS